MKIITVHVMNKLKVSEKTGENSTNTHNWTRDSFLEHIKALRNQDKILRAKGSKYLIRQFVEDEIQIH